PQDLEDIINQYDSAIDNSQRFYAQLTEDLRQGKIDVDQWEREMQRAVEDTHRTAALLVFGPLFYSIPQVAEFVNGVIATELSYLARFAQKVRQRAIPLDGQLRRRVALYLSAGRKTLWQLARMGA